MGEERETAVTKPILIEIDIEKKLDFQEALKKRKNYRSMKDAITDWINLYLQNSLYSKDCIIDYITLTFNSLINSQQVEKRVFDIFMKQFNDNLLMFSPENVKEAVKRIKESDLDQN